MVYTFISITKTPLSLFRLLSHSTLLITVPLGTGFGVWDANVAFMDPRPIRRFVSNLESQAYQTPIGKVFIFPIWNMTLSHYLCPISWIHNSAVFPTELWQNSVWNSCFDLKNSNFIIIPSEKILSFLLHITITIALNKT